MLEEAAMTNNACVTVSSENEDNQVARVESADCHKKAWAVESFGVEVELENRKGG